MGGAGDKRRDGDKIKTEAAARAQDRRVLDRNRSRVKGEDRQDQHRFTNTEVQGSRGKTQEAQGRKAFHAGCLAQFQDPSIATKGTPRKLEDRNLQ
jgi:transposase